MSKFFTQMKLEYDISGLMLSTVALLFSIIIADDRSRGLYLIYKAILDSLTQVWKPTDI